MDQDAPNAQLLTPARLCWVMDVGESTEAAWREAKLISFFKQGRNIRYEPASVLEFIARHTTRARGARPITNSDLRVTNSELDWQRIERLIADQVRAHLAKPEMEKAA